MALEMATTVVLAKTLGAASFGIYSFAFAVTRIVALPAQAGLPTLAVREVAKYHALGTDSYLKGFITWSSRTVVIFSLLLAVAGTLAAFGLSAGRDDVEKTTLVLAFILVPFVALGNLRGGILRGLHKLVLGQLPENIIRPIIFISLLYCWAHGNRLDSSSAMALHILAAFVSFISGAWMLRKALPVPVRRSESSFDAASWVRALIPLSVFGGMQVLNAQISVIALGAFRSAEEVGVYRVASQVGLFTGFGLIVVNMAVAPALAKAHALSSTDYLRRLMANCANAIFGATLVAFLTITFFGTQILAFGFGEKFVEGYVPLLVIGAGQALSSLAGVSMIALNMTGNEKLLTKSVSYSTGLNLLGHFALVPTFGLIGAALSTAISTVMGAFLSAYYVRKALRISPCIALP
jgi:O-antigen/teichoic acid export membrane protein